MSEGSSGSGPDTVEEVYARIADAFFALDEEWRFTFLNEEAERLLDRTQEELLGQNVWEAFPEAIGSTFQEEYERAMETQQPVSLEEYYPPLDTWFEVRAYPSPSGLSVYFHDVTERVRHRQELRGREQALREAYRVVGDTTRSSTKKIQGLLDRVRERLGTEYGLLSRIVPEEERYVVEALSGPSGAEIEVGDELGLVAVPCCHDVFLSGETLAVGDVEAEAPRLVHETLGVSSYLGAPVLVNGEAYGTFCFFDTEETRESFTDWEQTFVGLLGRWASSELEREKRRRDLERANERLVESNRQLERFAQAASHDLQEPARTVATHLQLIRERYAEDLGEDSLELLGYAMQGARSMRDIVRGLLTYASVETGEASFAPVDLDAVLARALASLEGELEATGAEVDADELPEVVGDEDQLHQLFVNLLDNAIQYAGEDQPRVTVTSDRVDDRWRVAVHDEGEGIAQPYRGRVFELFERLHTQAEHPGAGLGLATCQRIVERHGGEIQVDSQPGEGSTFWFTLPASTLGSPTRPGEPPAGRGSLVH